MKNLFKATLLVLLQFFPFWAYGQVSITEIMYDLEGADTGREWIEVRNAGPEAIDIDSWKIFEGEVNHKITAVSESILPGESFGVIADSPEKFRADNPSYSGLLFDSVFSLSNDGETIILRDGIGTDVDSLTYESASGAQGDGNSLHKDVSGWVVGSPTPGSGEIGSAPSSSVDSGDENDEDGPAPANEPYSSHSSQTVATISKDEQELVMTAGRSRMGFTGVPLSFEAKVKSMKNVVVGHSSYEWSMGDGDMEYGQLVSHAYDFPGEYIVILNTKVGDADAVSRIKVKIVEPQIEVSASETADYIEISNVDSRELNVGNWVLASRAGRYTIAEDTVIISKKSIKIADRITGLSDKIDLKLLDPLGRERAASIRVPIATGGDVSIVLPDGFSIDVFKEKIASEIDARKMTVDEKNERREQKAEEHRPQKIASDERKATSSTMAAAVVYTVHPRREDGWIDRIISVFKR